VQHFRIRDRILVDQPSQFAPDNDPFDIDKE
jgi:hypothetical protein